MSYEDFEASFVKENKKMRWLLFTVILVMSLIVACLFFEKKYFVYMGHPIFEERVTAELICKKSFESLVSGELDNDLIHEDIIKIVKKEPFDLEIKKILKLESIQTGFCKMVFTTNDKLYSFKVGLSEGDSNPFYYKLISLDQLGEKSL